MSAVPYYGSLIATKSRAYELLTKEKDIKALDKHLKDVGKAAKVLMTQYAHLEKPFTVVKMFDEDEEAPRSDVLYTPFEIKKIDYIKELLEFYSRNYESCELDVFHIPEKDMVYLSIHARQLDSPDGPSTTHPIAILQWDKPSEDLYNWVKQAFNERK